MLNLARVGTVALAVFSVAHGLAVRQAAVETTDLELGTQADAVATGLELGVVTTGAEIDTEGDAVTTGAEIDTEGDAVTTGAEIDTEEDAVPVFDTVQAADLTSAPLEVPEDLPDATAPAPEGVTVITDPETAPVGVLDLPDSIPGEEVFSAASFEEENFESVGVQQTSATNFDGTGCPTGTGRPLDQPNAACTKPRGSILGSTFWDANFNNVRDSGEAPVPGILLTITDKAATFRASVRTDTQGHYQINNLPPGTFYITLDLSTSPPGLTPVLDQVAVAVQPYTNVIQDFPYQGAGAAPIYDQSTIEGFVFIDANKDGVFDAGDSAVPNVRVELTVPGGNLQVATTGANGKYEFTELAAGTYNAMLQPTSLPEGYTATRSSFQTTLGENQQFTDGDFPLVSTAPTARIGPSFVFIDINNDGEFRVGDKPLPGMVVTLSDISPSPRGFATREATTDANGQYSFSQLPASEYQLSIKTAALPADYTSVRPNGIIKLSIADGEIVTTAANFPVLPPATGSVGPSYIYHDANNNGKRDVGELGISNVVVNLVDAGGKTVASARSDSSGNFRFDKVKLGTFNVVVDQSTVPSRFKLFPPTPSSVTITAGGTAPGIVIRGITNVSGISSSVAFVDDNLNGKQDSGEANVPNVKILLLSGNTQVQTTTTDASGRYSFSNVAPGTYTIRVDRATIPYGLATVSASGDTKVVVPAGNPVSVDIPFKKLPLSRVRGQVLQTTTPLPNVKINVFDSAGKFVSSSVTDSTGTYSVSNLPAGTYNLQVDTATLPPTVVPSADAGNAAVTVRWGDSITVNFVFKPSYAIVGPGFVYNDANGNGLLDGTESGVSGVTIDLVANDNRVIATTKSDASGEYQFNNVVPGPYTVRMVPSTIPSQFSAPTTSYTVKIEAGQQFTGNAANFALRTTAPLPSTGGVLGYVYRDDNGNGKHDGSDSGVPKVTLDIAPSVVPSNATPNPSSVQSDAQGRYTFSGLAVGSYVISVRTNTLPADQGVSQSCVATVSAGKVTTDPKCDFLVSSGQITPLAGIVGSVLGVNDSPLSGVTVSLLNSSGGLKAKQTTTASGQYIFNDLVSGTYTVVVDSATVPANLQPVSDPDSVADGKTTITLTSVPVTAVFRYGLAEQTRRDLEGFVYYDANNDGVMNGGERGAELVLVQLKSGNQLISSVKTDGSGRYKFNVAFGTYTLYVDPSTVRPGYTVEANNLQAVASVEPTISPNFALRSTTSNLGSISGSIFRDTEPIGVYGSGDQGLITTVTLLDRTGTVPIRTTTSNTSGFYSFPDLSSGSYIVSPTLPGGVTLTVKPNGTQGTRAAVNVAPKAQITNFNFGYLRSTNPIIPI